MSEQTPLAALEAGINYRRVAAIFNFPRSKARELAVKHGLLNLPNGWSNEKLDALKALLGERLSAAEIGKRLGVTRNAVIGQCHRRGWKLPKNSPTRKAGAKPERDARVRELAAQGLAQFQIAREMGISDKTVHTILKRLGIVARKGWSINKKQRPRLDPPPPIEDMSIPLEQRKHFLELTPKCCRWPLGDPQSGFWDGNLFFCGAVTVEKMSYCPAHLWRSAMHV